MALIILALAVLLLSLWLTHSGQGGKFNNGSTDIDITDWELTRTARVAEITVSSSGHVIRKFVVEDGTWRFNMPLDSTELLDTDVNMAPGDENTGADFFVGDSTKFYSFTVLVETLQIINNSTNDVVRAVCSGFINSTVTEPIT